MKQILCPRKEMLCRSHETDKMSQETDIMSQETDIMTQETDIMSQETDKILDLNPGNSDSLGLKAKALYMLGRFTMITSALHWTRKNIYITNNKKDIKF